MSTAELAFPLSAPPATASAALAFQLPLLVQLVIPMIKQKAFTLLQHEFPNHGTYIYLLTYPPNL